MPHSPKREYGDAYKQILAEIGKKYEFTRVQRKLEDICQRLCPEKIECLYANWQDQSLSVG